MRRLDRYIFTEILGPLGLGFLIYTLILTLRHIFDSAELVIRRGVPFSFVGKLTLLYMPSVVVLTIPMALLFGILVAVGRLSADSELTAIRASGVSLFSLYRPILVLSLMLAGINAYFMLNVLPQGNTALQTLRVEIAGQNVIKQVEPGLFYSEWPNKTFYVFESPPGQERWHGVLLTDSVPKTLNELTVAEWGEARAEEDASQVVLQLQNATQHQVDLSAPDTYKVVSHSNLEMAISQERPSSSRSSVSRSMRTLTLDELRARAEDPSLDETVRRVARVEMHKKFSFPAACLVFGLIALPLGFTNNRGGRSSGFAVSLGVVLVYWILLTFGEEMASEGTLPPALAVWSPNLAFFLAGLFFLARRNRDKSLLLSNMDRWIRVRVWDRLLSIRQRQETRRKARQQLVRANRRARADLVLRLPPVSLRFPNSVDRYLLKIYLRIFLLVAASGVLIYVVGDITENFDDFLQNKVAGSVIADYYTYNTLAIFYEISPILVLVSVLITFGLLSRSNELTALKALGISLYRLAVPVLLASAALAVGVGLLEAKVLPDAQVRISKLKDVIKGRATSPTRARGRADRRWLFGQEGFLYNYLRYNAEQQQLERLQVFQFDDEFRLRRRLMAEQATYDGDGWWTFSQGGWTRTFNATGVEEFQNFDEAVRVQIPERPEFFEGEERTAEEMPYPELKEYIAEIERSGRTVPDLEVQLHLKVAYPANALVMALVALPFSFLMGRRGALYGIGLSIVVGIVFMALLATFKALGEASVLPPVVAVWAPSAVFAIFSLYLFLGVRT